MQFSMFAWTDTSSLAVFFAAGECAQQMHEARVAEAAAELSGTRESKELQDELAALAQALQRP